jgi:molybdopterin-guanine dinucleotide biosynthesis protein A
MDAFNRAEVSGVILAGGEGRRMDGRDKGLVPLLGRPMVEYALHALRPQVHSLFINANRSRDDYARFGLPLVGDEFPGFNGPLAGMASCLRVVSTPWMVTVPCDSPLLPADLVARLGAAVTGAKADIGMAHNGERTQPVFALLRATLLDSMLEFLAAGERKIDRWFARHRTAIADFSDTPQAFLNVNTPDELQELERLIGARDA